MRHLVHLFKNGMKEIPRRAAEFGPGNSLGAGLCALLSGTGEYYALDLVEHTDKARSLSLLDELAGLFREKSPIPDDREFPRIRPFLEDYSFPDHIFGDEALRDNLAPQRIEAIKTILSRPGATECGGIRIRYVVPWENYPGAYPEVDFVFSQAVLEHIDHLEEFYQVMARILRPGAFVSHDIDFRSHYETYEWNGHWAFSAEKWKKIRGRRPYLLNRKPLSAHIGLFEKNGFEILEKAPCSGALETASIGRKRLAAEFAAISDEDFETSTCFIVARRRHQRRL
jgi:SAM-dependent methyltransferase